MNLRSVLVEVAIDGVSGCANAGAPFGEPGGRGGGLTTVALKLAAVDLKEAVLEVRVLAFEDGPLDAGASAEILDA